MSDISDILSVHRQLSERSRASEKWQQLISRKWWLLAVISVLVAVAIVLLVAGINKAVESNKTKSGAKFGSGVKAALESIKKDLEEAEVSGDPVKMEAVKEKFRVLESVFGASNLKNIVGSQSILQTLQSKLNSSIETSQQETSTIVPLPLQDEPFQIPNDAKNSFVLIKKKSKEKLKSRVGKGLADYE